MKKIFVAILFAIGVHTVSAQSVKFGIKSGPTLSKMQSKEAGGTVGTESNIGFMFGGYSDINIGSFNLQPGLAIIGKGGKSSDAGDEIKIGLMYLELPVNIIHHFPIGIGSVFFGAGPYAALGVSGKAQGKFTSNGQDDSASTFLKFGSGTEEINRYDYGANILGGVQLKKGVNLGLNYGIGLGNLNNSPADGKTTNQVFSLTLGYFFKIAP